MKFGATLRNLSDLPPLEVREYLLTGAQAADELGFYSVFCSDHMVVPKGFTSSYPYHKEGKWSFNPDNNMFELLTVLSCISSVTKRVRLGTSVLVLPLRHPVYTAKILATLDVMSRGRLILGAGVGWFREEMEAMGSPTYEQRGAMADEYLTIFKELWTKDDANVQGRWFKVSGFSLRPRPLQKPHPPLWIGGLTDAALRRVVRFGDGWHGVGLEPDELATHIRKIRELAKQQGRDVDHFEYSMSSVVTVDLDAKGGGEARLVGREAGQPVLVGNPQQIATMLKRYKAAGLTHYSAYYQASQGRNTLDKTVKAFEAISKEVMPQLR
ncbi:MAG: LLM class F420-dependent oxidoreductase [Chloroflexi bacterium]|nr:LLM class F420-dependent oxidoreductase [Chloroflexota bacterium]